MSLPPKLPSRPSRPSLPVAEYARFEGNTNTLSFWMTQDENDVVMSCFTNKKQHHLKIHVIFRSSNKTLTILCGSWETIFFFILFALLLRLQYGAIFLSWQYISIRVNIIEKKYTIINKKRHSDRNLEPITYNLGKSFVIIHKKYNLYILCMYE